MEIRSFKRVVATPSPPHNFRPVRLRLYRCVHRHVCPPGVPGLVCINISQFVYVAYYYVLYLLDWPLFPRWVWQRNHSTHTNDRVRRHAVVKIGLLIMENVALTILRIMWCRRIKKYLTILRCCKLIISSRCCFVDVHVGECVCNAQKGTN